MEEDLKSSMPGCVLQIGGGVDDRFDQTNTYDLSVAVPEVSSRFAAKVRTYLPNNEPERNQFIVLI